AAHQKDLAVGAKHDVKYLNYWLDEQTGTIRCLVEAPSAEAAVAVHKEAHGLVPDAIEEGSEGRGRAPIPSPVRGRGVRERADRASGGARQAAAIPRPRIA